MKGLMEKGSSIRVDPFATNTWPTADDMPILLIDYMNIYDVATEMDGWDSLRGFETLTGPSGHKYHTAWYYTESEKYQISQIKAWVSLVPPEQALKEALP